MFLPSNSGNVTHKENTYSFLLFSPPLSGTMKVTPATFWGTIKPIQSALRATVVTAHCAMVGPKRRHMCKPLVSGSDLSLWVLL